MGKKVIVVDDSRAARLLVRGALSGDGYEIIEAEDGVAGEATVTAHQDAALVLCDVNMPVVGGLEMIATLREKGRCGSAVFVMLTTESDARLMAGARRAGVIGWIAKPFKSALLLATVRRLVGDA